MLIEQTKKALEELRKYPKEYIEVCKETKGILMDEAWLEINFHKLNIDYRNVREGDP